MNNLILKADFDGFVLKTLVQVLAWPTNLVF